MKRWKQTWIVADSLSCCCQRCVGEKFHHNEWKYCTFCWAALRPNSKSGALKFFRNILLGIFLSRDDYKQKFTRRERKKYSVVEMFTVQCSRGSALLRTEDCLCDTHAVLRSTSTSLLTTSSSVYCIKCVQVYTLYSTACSRYSKNAQMRDVEDFQYSSNTVLYCGILSLYIRNCLTFYCNSVAIFRW